MTESTASVRTVEGPSGSLRVLTHGDPAAPPLLLVHPINLRADCWLDFVSLLSDEWHVVMPDLRGHGLSTANGPFGVPAWVADCEAVADALCDGPFHAIGGSLGGTICVALAATSPERVRSVMTLGSAARSGVQRERVLRMIDELGTRGMFRKAFGEFTFGPETPPEVVDRAVEMANPNDEPVVRAVWNATQDTDIRDLAARVSCPITVLTGEHDTTCPPPRGQELAEITGATFRLLPHVGHMPMLEAPEVVLQAWTEHLAQAGFDAREASR